MKEQSALDELSNKRRYLDQQQTQLDGLLTYQDQTMSELKLGMQNVHDVSRLQSGQNFIHQIAQAITHQRKVNENANKEYAVALKNWTACHQKTKNMSDLINRYRSQEQQTFDRKLEKQLEDEFNSRRFR